ncbi:hypothetical protein C8R45DRAFT_945064 [Mycena sanguinolenta]|nr:hypothetical protein C8R45DRAFT_945064 [Mycena sanguinolenta]
MFHKLFTTALLALFVFGPIAGSATPAEPVLARTSCLPNGMALLRWNRNLEVYVPDPKSNEESDLQICRSPTLPRWTNPEDEITSDSEYSKNIQLNPHLHHANKNARKPGINPNTRRLRPLKKLGIQISGSDLESNEESPSNS